ncbi:unnamed protein product (macronuclear) [Paramecium tetraurelia]|uniref:SUEL-type lectin domain-containing protein n=1 Tax=Paramecium tetraurelia TaxID=5888 RepID=A0C4M5_PARTE|nr:uncharacterized protein GSPATT00006241001 [Paramecium tetraurelia]CAK65742.1 unnamed protein product [Paramecium tetraurelia]|eukprot:XP_001433139.1 hypothetical protein (macronuclear) [Paramecium tetraurelia strain d4-2]
MFIVRKYHSEIGAFFEVCQTIDFFEAQNLGCSDRINKFACMSLQKQKCTWNNKCELLRENTIKNNQQCNYHEIAVTPYTCQQLKSGLCKISFNQGMNSGLEGDYRCVEVRIDQLSTITCNQPGLNDQACLSIITEDQYCVFLDDQCKSIEPKQVFSCNQLNKNACISIMLNSQQLLCEWIDSFMQNIQLK